jgi:hypothetical protein
MLFEIYQITVFKYKNMMEERKPGDFKIGGPIS